MRAGIWFGLLAGAVWGAVFLVPAWLPQFPPLLLSIGRYLMYGAFSLALGWPWLPRLLRRLTRTDARMLLELALTGNLVYYLLVAAAVQWAGVAPTALIVGTTPVVISLLGLRDAGAVRLHALWLPLMLVLAGVACINADVLVAAHAQQKPLVDRLLGMACAAGAVLSWSWYAVRNARYLKSQARFDGQQWSLLWGVATGAVGLLALGIAWLLPGHLVAAPEATAADWWRFWGLNLALAVGSSWFGNWMWNAASRRLPLTLSAQVLVFETLFALGYGLLWAGRGPSGLELLALVMLLAGVVLAARRHAVPPAT